MSDESRRSPRRRMLKGATIIFGNGAFTRKCVVKNQSETGVLLEMEGTDGVPNQFRLVFEDRTHDRQCEVAWRTARRLGVKFAADPAATSAEG